MNHSLHRIRQLHINPPGGNSGNDAFKGLANPLLHILDFFQLFRLPFRLIGSALCFRGMLCHLRKDFLIMGDSLICQLSPELLPYDTVNLQIRVSPDRGGKVTVILTCKAKVSRTVHGILRPFHAPQGQAANHRLLLASLYFIKELLDFLGMDFRNRSPASVFQLEVIAEIVDKGSKLCNLFRVRIVMGSVQKGNLHPVKMLCHRLIGKEHKVLYELRRRISFVRFDGNGHAVLV